MVRRAMTQKLACLVDRTGLRTTRMKCHAPQATCT
jgi:hypothetical protein